MTRSATGNLYTISSSEGDDAVVAVISAVGAGIHSLRHGGLHITIPNPLQAMPPASNGAILVPWPNRIRDGLWTLDGKPQQLAISEPPKHNAIHGLLSQTEYSLVSLTENSVTLAATVYPRKGYPFLLDTEIEFSVNAGGLTIAHRIANVGEAAAPVAIGAHPYLQIEGVPTADLVFRSRYHTRLEVDEQLIPIGTVDVAGTDFDASTGLRVGDMAFDHAFTELPVIDGVVEHSVSAPDGRSVRLWADPQFGYVQVYSPHNFPGAEGPTTAIAVEPMTAPADAFNSSDGLRWLNPGENWSATWGITADLAAAPSV